MPNVTVAATPVVPAESPDMTALLSDLRAFLSAHTTASSTAPPGSTSPWYFDSACFNHMSPQSDLLTCVTPVTNSPTIHTADNSTLLATHCGTATTDQLSLPYTLLVPDLSLNL